jgi:hypothetical protein
MNRFGICRVCSVVVPAHPTGSVPIFCTACRRQHYKQKAAQWYIEKRQDNPVWRLENSERAKNWRAAQKHRRLEAAE